jgi:hypothetical protein
MDYRKLKGNKDIKEMGSFSFPFSQKKWKISLTPFHLVSLLFTIGCTMLIRRAGKDNAR